MEKYKVTGNKIYENGIMTRKYLHLYCVKIEEMRESKHKLIYSVIYSCVGPGLNPSDSENPDRKNPIKIILSKWSRF